MDVSVQDSPEQHRFQVVVDGRTRGFAAYRQREGAIVITHSEVDPALRGQGVGQELARRTLDLVRERGDRVVAQCPFFARYIAEHPEYADLVES
ncbi:MAG TPA: GNAT family N-acetyltransferase [Actinoplanes sp.]